MPRPRGGSCGLFDEGLGCHEVGQQDSQGGTVKLRPGFSVGRLARSIDEREEIVERD